jgi:hypothetical protein
MLYGLLLGSAACQSVYALDEADHAAPVRSLSTFLLEKRRATHYETYKLLYSMAYRFHPPAVPHHDPGRVLADTASIIGWSAKYGINLWITYHALDPGRLPALPAVSFTA